MKIIVADTLESIADYQLREVDPPVAGAGQVLIEVAACGVGYVDSLVALGRYQVKPPLPHTPGQEVAGRIVALGEGVTAPGETALAPDGGAPAPGGPVTGLQIGDRVMATVRGGFAERALAAANDVWRIAPRMRFEQAAGFRVNYLTALHGLRDRAMLAPGERLLVIGAAGGVGIAAVQIGRLLGAEVIACASSPEKREHALAYGAARAIDTDPQGWRDRLKEACGGRGPDVVFDPSCGPLFEPAFRSLSWRGRHLVVGFVGGPIPALPANLSLMKGAAMVGVDVRQFGLFESERARAHLRELLQWVGEGRLDPPVGRQFAFHDYRSCLEFALSGQGLGKTVLRVASGE